MKKINLTKFKKALSILCAVSLIAVSISVVFSVIAVEESTTTVDDGRTVYNFENGAWSEENTDGFHVGTTETFKTVENDKEINFCYVADPWGDCKKLQIIDDDEEHNKVLKVSNSENAARWPVILLNDGAGAYELKKDKQYTISFDYKVVNGGNTSDSWMTLVKGVKSSTSDPKLATHSSVFEDYTTSSTATSKKENYKIIRFNSTSVKQCDGIGTATPNTDVANPDGWNTFTTTFTGMEMTEVTGGTRTGMYHPYLAIFLTLQTDAEIYFDNFEIKTKSTVTFNANGGKISGQDSFELSGEIGAALSVSDPVKDGVEFLGWYTDTELTVPFESTKFPAQDVTVYAKYSDSLVKCYDFEDETTKTTGTLNVGGNDLRVTSFDTTTPTDNKNQFSIVEVDGNKVLQIAHPSKTNTGGDYQPGVFLLNDGEKPYALTPGKTYTFSMRYKLVNVQNNNFAWIYLTQSPTATGITNAGNWNLLESKFNAIAGDKHGSDADKANRIISDFQSSANGTIVDRSGKTVNDINGQQVTKGEWQTISCTFTAKDLCYDADYQNYIGFATCTIPGLKVYIDDIVLLEESDSYKAILFDSNGGSDVAPIAGKNTTAIVTPTPQNDSFILEGWYTDKALTQKFTETTYGELTDVVTTVYANWVVKYGSVFDFENGSTIAAGEVNGTQVSSYASGSADEFKNIYHITTEENGNKVLEIKHPEAWNGYIGDDRETHYKNGCFILNKDGIIPELEPGKTYTVSMRVKINSPNRLADPRVALTEAFNTKYNANYSEFGNIYGASSAFCDDFTEGSRSNSDYLLIRNFSSTGAKDINGGAIPLGEWVTITKTFTAYPDRDDTGNLFIGFTSCTGINLSIYIDDICFYDNAKNHALSFNTNGISSVANKYPAVGEKIELPTPTYENYEFAGWYTDSELENKAPNPYVMGESDAILYAKWIWKKVTVDFEGGYTDNQTNVSVDSSFGGKFYLNKLNANNHGTVMDESTYNAAGCYNDSTSSLLIKINDGGNSSALLRSNLYSNGITAQNGERFTVTFKYKVEGTLAANTNLKVGYTIMNNNGWYEVKNDTSSVAELKNGDGWQTATITYAFDESTYTNSSNGTTYLDPTKPQYIHLQIMPTAPDQVVNVYVDDVTVTKVDIRDLVGLKKSVGSNQGGSDLNNDGNVNTDDIKAMRKLLLGNK